MKETSSHDKGLINGCLSCYSFLSDVVARTFVIQTFTVKEGGGRGGTAPLYKVAVQTDDLLPHICIEGTYCISMTAFANGFKQLESPASWHTTDLPSQMAGFKKERRMKTQVSKICIPSCNKET